MADLHVVERTVKKTICCNILRSILHPNTSLFYSNLPKTTAGVYIKNPYVLKTQLKTQNIHNRVSHFYDVIFGLFVNKFQLLKNKWTNVTLINWIRI